MPQQLTIRQHYVRDCNLMLRYALNKGITIPASVIKTLEAFNLKECIDHGEAIPPGATVDEKVVGDIKTLVTTHERLTKIVYPATPDSIRYISEEENKNSWWRFLSPISFIRQMMAAAFFCLLAFMGLSLIKVVGMDTSQTDFLGMEGGLERFSNILFFLTAAGLGASFAELFQADEYITKGTFEPRYRFSYWARFMLGLIAGLLFATLMPLGDPSTEMGQLARPTMAMVGGFASSLVYKTLKRLVEMVEIFIGGKSKAVKKVTKQRDKVFNEIKDIRGKLTRQIAELSEDLNSGMDPKKVKAKVDKMFDDLVPPQETTAEERDYENRKKLPFELDKEHSANEEQYRQYEYRIPADESVADSADNVG